MELSKRRTHSPEFKARVAMDPLILAEHRDARCKQTQQTIAKAMEGNYEDDHLFELENAFLFTTTIRRESQDAKIESMNSYRPWLSQRARRTSIS